MGSSPDVAAAIDRLARDGILTPAQAILFGREARGELATVAPLLHGLLYLGVLAITAGVGLLLAGRVADLGPLALALVVGAAAAGCLAWVWRTAPPFARAEVPPPGIAFEYALVLGALLAAADLAWVEVQFTPLGAGWSWHLLLVATAHVALAFRFDSRVLFALALASFAAWRGVAVLAAEQALFLWTYAGAGLAVRLNVLGCGLLFLAVGQACLQARIKPHFEPVATLLGWVLVLAAAAGGIGMTDGSAVALAHRVALLALGTFLAWREWPAATGPKGERSGDERSGRYLLLVMGVLAAWVAFLAITLPWFPGTSALLYVAVTAGGVLAVLLRAHRQRGARSP
jgi:hypothetical protein